MTYKVIDQLSNLHKIQSMDTSQFEAQCMSRNGRGSGGGGHCNRSGGPYLSPEPKVESHLSKLQRPIPTNEGKH